MLKLELRRLGRNSLIYGIGGVLQRFIGLLLLPLFTRTLSPEDYGVASLIGLVSAGLAGLFNLGTGNSMGVLYFREEDPEKKPTIIWSNTALLLGVIAILVLVFVTAARVMSTWVFETPARANLLRIAVVSLALTTITDPFYAYLRMEEKAKWYVVLTLIGSMTTLLLSTLLVLVLRWGVAGLLLASLFGQALMLAIVLGVIARRLPIRVDPHLFVPLVRIGFPSIFGLFAFLVIDYGGRQILQRMMGLEQLGIYSIGYSFGMVMMIFVSAFATAWPPFFVSFINRREDAKIIFGRVLKYYLIAFGLLTMLFFAAARPVVAVMVAPAFDKAFTVIGMVAAAYALRGCYLILLPGLYFAEKLKWQSAIEWVAALLNIGLSLWWIPRYGIMGAAGATLVSYLALPVLSWAIGQWYLPVDYDWPRIGVAALALGISGFALFRVSRVGTPFTAMTYSALILTALMIVFGLGVLSVPERRLMVDRCRAFAKALNE